MRAVAHQLHLNLVVKRSGYPKCCQFTEVPTQDREWIMRWQRVMEERFRERSFGNGEEKTMPPKCWARYKTLQKVPGGPISGQTSGTLWVAIRTVDPELSRSRSESRGCFHLFSIASHNFCRCLGRGIFILPPLDKMHPLPAQYVHRAYQTKYRFGINKI